MFDKVLSSPLKPVTTSRKNSPLITSEKALAISYFHETNLINITVLCTDKYTGPYFQQIC